MRWSLALVGAALLCAPTAARAAVPVSLDLAAGVGLGGGGRTAFATTGPMVGTLAADLAWRRASGSALVVSGEYLGSGKGPGAEPAGIRLMIPPIYAPPGSLRRLDFMDGRSILIGWRHARPRSGPSWQAAVGAGSLVAPGWHSRPGLALGGAAGWRILPPPGPVGFVLEARGSYLRSGSSYLGAVTLGLGLAIQPR